MINIPSIDGWQGEREYAGNYADDFQANIKRLEDMFLNHRQDLLTDENSLEEFKADFKECYEKHGANYNDYFRYQLYKNRDEEYRSKLVTKSRRLFVYNYINQAGMVPWLSDKVLFAQHWADFYGKKWCDLDRTSKMEFIWKFKFCKRLVVKPVFGYGGKFFEIIDVHHNLGRIYDRLKKSRRYKIVEEFVYQKGLLHEFNPTSLNTLRVITARENGEIHTLFSQVRVGGKGALVDNMHAGGAGFPINVKTGEITQGFDYTGKSYTCHPETGVQIAGRVIPSWDKVLKFCADAHRTAPEGLELIGWDVCLSDDQICLIEGNASPGIPNPVSEGEDQWGMISRLCKLDHKRNEIVVHEPIVLGKRVIYTYSVKGPWSRYFKTGRIYDLRYEFPLEDIPKSILMVPFVANILPLIWVADAKATIPYLDKNFYDCFDNLKEGYKKMHPVVSFNGEFSVGELVENRKENMDRSVVMFSCGADAYTTLIRHLDENPDMLIIWGADIPSWKIDGWQVLEKKYLKAAKDFHLDPFITRSNFKNVLDLKLLNVLVEKETGDKWWHGFQHGVLLLSHAAVLCWKRNIGKVYIASSFTAGDVYTCASDPTLDNHVRFCGARAIHDGYELDRQKKLHLLSDYVEKSGKEIDLHVCWEDKGGSNCCHCEKCWRTMMGLYAEGADLHKFGFNKFNSMNEIAGLMKENIDSLRERTVSRYGPSQRLLKEKYKKAELSENLQWFYDLNLAEVMSEETEV